MDNNPFMADGIVAVQADSNQAKLYNHPHIIAVDGVTPDGGQRGF